MSVILQSLNREMERVRLHYKVLWEIQAGSNPSELGDVVAKRKHSNLAEGRVNL